MKKKTKTNKARLEVVKYKALQLRGRYQIPYRLCYHLTQIDKDTDFEVVEYLLCTCEHYLRVRGYYKKFPQLEEQANKEIEEGYRALLGIKQDIN